jgi:hypothetical protein
MVLEVESLGNYLSIDRCINRELKWKRIDIRDYYTMNIRISNKERDMDRNSFFEVS